MLRTKGNKIISAMARGVSPPFSGHFYLRLVRVNMLIYGPSQALKVRVVELIRGETQEVTKMENYPERGCEEIHVGPGAHYQNTQGHRP